MVSRATLCRGTVLVVDPDDLAQSVVAAALGEAGFGVIRTYDMTRSP